MTLLHKPIRQKFSAYKARLICVVIAAIFCSETFAQNINTIANFPDPNFRASVEGFMKVAPGGSFTAAQASSKTGYLNCSSQSVTDLTGIEYFPNITRLYCQDNNLASIDLSNNTELIVLYCYANSLSSLDLSNHTKLEVVSCYSNALTNLNLTNCTSLRLIYCLNNLLPILNVSDCVQLTNLHCQNNFLVGLDITNNPLMEYLYCHNNLITSIQVSDQSAIKEMNASNNKMTGITDLLTIGLDPAANIDIRLNDLFHDDWYDLQTLDGAVGGAFLYEPQNGASTIFENINTLTNFPDSNFRAKVEDFMGVGPGGAFTSASAAAQTGWLNCAGSSITSVTGIEFFPNITRFYCQGNSLTSMDLSNNQELVVLYCYNNTLDEIVLGNQSKLEVFSCYNNSLTNLNLTSCTSLRLFYCFNNQFSSLDISNCGPLTRLQCYDNQLTSLDISNNSLLEYLYCQNNLITSFQVTDQSAIKDINASNNKMTGITDLLTIGLDSSANIDIRLNDLYHDDWYDLQTLDGAVGGSFLYEPQNGTSTIIENINTPANFPDPNFRAKVEDFMGVGPSGAFTSAAAAAQTGWLNCAGSTITSVSGIQFFPNITRLYCQSNNLSSLDLSSNTQLIVLYCYNNNLSNLVLGNQSKLEVFSCYNNPLTSLDLSNCTSLRLFYCFNNQLASLNISNCGQLTRLQCNDNQLTSLDISNNSLLEYVYCQNNLISTIQVTNQSAIKDLNASNNKLTEVTSLLPIGLAPDAKIDIRLNDLYHDDWYDLQTLEGAVGGPFLYEPQNGAAVIINNINTPTNFPDPNFRAKVESFMGVAPGGAFASASAASKTGWLNCAGSSINNVTGIEFFPNITRLYCQGNNISSMDLSNNSALQVVYCSSNNLDALAFENHPALEVLSCYHNQITNLTLTGCANLRLLYCAQNQLSSLDLTNCSQLEILHCYQNQLAALDLTNKPNFSNLFAAENNLQSISFDSTSNLVQVNVASNAFSSLSSFLNVSGFGSNSILDVSDNQLSEDDLSDIQTLENQIGAGFQYTVNDLLPPAITCPSNVSVNATDPAGMTVNFDLPIVTDILDPSPSIVCTPASGSFFALGDSIVNCTATDAAGNTSHCQFVISVLDGAPPLITLTGASYVALEANVDTFSDPGATAVDEVDGPVSVQVGGAIVDSASVDTYIITYDAVDAAGNNAAQVIRTVQVQDTLPPTIECPEPQTFGAVDASGAVVAYSPPTVSDIADATPTFVCTPASGSLFPLGDTIVACTATDFSGNAANCEFTISVVDTTPPIISLNGTSVITLEANVDSFTDPGAIATDNVDGGVQVNVGGDVVDPATIGTYVITYNAVDTAGNHAAQVIRTVQVQDTIAPTIECPEPQIFNAVDASGAVVDYLPPVVTDITDPAPTLVCVPPLNSLFPLGDTIVSCTATDFSGNTSTCQFIVTVKDKTPPIITLFGSSAITLEANVDSFTDPGATATDNVDGSVQVFVAGDVVNTANVGTYIVTYNAVDAAGNSATQITRTVQVQDTLPPAFAGTDNYADMENAQCGEYTDVMLEVTLSDLTDSNPVVQTTFAYADGASETRSTLPTASEAFPIGTSSITLSATDASGNSTTASFTVTVLPRTTLNVTAGYIQAGHFTPSANMPIYIYELTTGNGADMVDGSADDSVPSDFYQTLYSTIFPDYTVNTNNDGKADIAVLFRNYFVVTGIDIDQSGTLDANDKYIGWQSYGLSCGDSKAINLIAHPYAVFAEHSAAIGYRTEINGDLAAKTSQTGSFVSGNSEITINTRVTINGNVLGDSVQIGWRSSVNGDVHYNELNKNNVTISGNEYTPIQLPLAAPCLSFPTITPGADSYTANVNQLVVLSPGAFDSITLNAGWNKSTFSTLQLEPGLYEINSLNLGSYSRLECLGPCEIRIKNKLSIGYSAYFGVQPGSQINEKDIKVYVEGVNGADGMLQSNPPAVWIQAYSDVYANIVAPNGTIRGDYRSKVFGALIGKWVDLNTLVTASN